MKTYTFFGGSITPGLVLADTEEHGKVLFLGEAGPGSWFTWIPLNKNLQNQPVVTSNIVLDAFLFNAGGDQRPLFILSRDHNQWSNSCLVRFLTVGESGKGNGYVSRIITGWRSRELVGGHGRNNGILPDNGTWSDEVWVVHEGELLRVQLAGCDTAFAVRVRNGEPTVEPWVEREPRQKPVSASDNGGNGNRQWRTLKGSHVADQSAPAWSPGVGEVQSQLTELDQELADMGQSRVAKFNARYQRQPVAA